MLNIFWVHLCIIPPPLGSRMKCFQAADTNTLPNYSQAEADPPNTQVLGSIPQLSPTRSSTTSHCGTLCKVHGAASGLLSPGEAFPPCLPSRRVLQCSPSTCTLLIEGMSSSTEGRQWGWDLRSLLRPRLHSMAQSSQRSFLRPLAKARAPLLSSAMRAYLELTRFLELSSLSGAAVLSPRGISVLPATALSVC